MIKGLYSAASAMLMNANRQQILSHNIANVDTPGFKQILTSAGEWIKTPVVYPAGKLTQSELNYIGQVGLGTLSEPEVTDFTQGGLNITGNTLDVGLQGDGFFRIRTPDGERYTRDGRFQRNANGDLVTFQGYNVLDSKGQPIKLPDGMVGISQAGLISVNNAPVAQIGTAVFQNPRAELTHIEGNYYSAAAAPSGKGAPQMLQGYLEMSNANSTQLMSLLVEVGRSYEAAQQMVQNQDELLGKTLSSLGKLGA
jgi:flagellar basal-body rod protein FlgF